MPSAIKPSSWSEENREWLNKVHTQSIPPDAPVCRACEKVITLRYCMVEGCGEMSHTTTHIVTHDIAQEYLDLVPTPESGSTIQQNLTLCNSHYQFLYRKVHFPEPCASCLTEPIQGKVHTMLPRPRADLCFFKVDFQL